MTNSGVGPLLLFEIRIRRKVFLRDRATPSTVITREGG
jgi:hypothetical protein